MCKAKVKLVYRQIMDETSQSAFEKAILQASYQEFLMKSQAYNPEGKFKTFSRMKANDGRANSLHYKLSFSVGHFIAQLNNKMPLVKDNLGNKLSFETARFELIESHTEEMAWHKVAINYETSALTLVELFGEYMLLTADDPADGEALQTFILRMQPDLSIVSYLAAEQPQMA
jgi:hypothetical protein